MVWRASSSSRGQSPSVYSAKESLLTGCGPLCSAFLVQGSYPQELLASWDEYKASQYPPSDEQIRPREPQFLFPS